MVSNPNSAFRMLSDAPSSQAVLKLANGIGYMAFPVQEHPVPNPSGLVWDPDFRELARQYFLEALTEASMRLSNGYGMKVTDPSRLLGWIGDNNNMPLLRDFFTPDLPAMEPTWARLLHLSAELGSNNAFQTLVEIALATSNEKWIRQNFQSLVRSMSSIGYEKTKGIIRRLPLDVSIRQGIPSLATWWGGDIRIILEFDWPRVCFKDRETIYNNLIWHTHVRGPSHAERLVHALSMAGLDFDYYYPIDGLGGSYGHDNSYDTDFFHLLDVLWLCRKYDIYEVIVPLSKQAKTRITVAGSIIAAHEGTESLLLYLHSRPAPMQDCHRKILLEAAFSLAAKLGDVAAIQSFAEVHVDANARALLSKFECSRSGLHPLIRASQAKHFNVVRMLVEMGSELTSDDILFNPLAAAVWSPEPLSDTKRLEKVNIVRYFLSKNLSHLYGVDAMVEAAVPSHRYSPDPFLRSASISSRLVPDDFVLDEEVIDLLIEAGIIPDEIQREGKSLLHFAIDRHCDLRTVELLIRRGAQIQPLPCPEDGKTMLHSAVGSLSKDREKIVKLLLQSGADCTMEYGGHTILESVLSVDGEGRKRSSLQLFSLLLASGAQLNGPAERLLKVRDCWAPVATRLLSLGAPDALIYQTIQAGADIDSPGSKYSGSDNEYTPLQCAITKGRLDIARHLLTRGVDINAPAVGLGGTALQTACNPAYGVEVTLGLIRFLLDNGADINALGASHGLCNTALQSAVRRGSMGAFCLLLDAGANIFGTADFSKPELSALSTAARLGRLDMLVMMLKRLSGSKNHVRDQYANAMRVAENFDYFEAAKIVRSFAREQGFDNLCYRGMQMASRIAT